MKYLLILITLLVIGILGEADYKDEVVLENQYKQMVCTGAWPNYKHIDLACDKPANQTQDRY